METKGQVIVNIALLLFIRIFFSYLGAWCLMFAIFPVLFSLFIFDAVIGGDYLGRGVFHGAILLNVVNGPEDTLGTDGVLSILSKASLMLLFMVEGAKLIIGRVTKKKVSILLRYKIIIAGIFIIIIHILGGATLPFINSSDDAADSGYLIFFMFCVISILGMLGYYGSHLLKEFCIKIFTQYKFISQ